MHRIPDVFEVEKPKSAWKAPEPTIENADEKKHLFGLELAKHPPFKAACEVFGDDTNTAVWVSQHWLNDPIVVATRDKYLEAANVSQSLLDKEQLARKFLKMAEEKNASNTFYILDGKDRLKALELYAQIMGYKDSKSDIPVNFIHNSMTIKLVEANKEKPAKIINNSPNEEITNSNPTGLKLKLVG
ncbi:MAG TPA: hypothetical protein VHA13_03345 [Gammaproteobacteria bacterium]|nr:hypothetical protein [Gammaproteobacteria bacterium]